MTDISTAQECARLLAATGLAGAIGLERELNAQAAGFRTHLLVGLGAAVFTVVGADVAGTDPTRVAAQVVTGVGFLGAGAILHDGVSVRGLTTAASLWVTAAVGVACGLGALTVAAVTTGIALAALVGLKVLERDAFPRRRGHVVQLRLSASADVRAVTDGAQDVIGAAVEVQRVAATDGDGILLVLRSPLRRGSAVLDLAIGLRALDGVVGVELGT